MPHARIGVSGWRYPSWRGDFYPKGLPQRLELTYAAERMTSIEVNGSFYSLQRPSSYAAWRAAVPSDVVLAVKGGRFITHMKALRDVEIPLANFFASGVLALGPQLGPVLWQLPERVRFDRERVRDFLELLPRRRRRPRGSPRSTTTSSRRTASSRPARSTSGCGTPSSRGTTASTPTRRGRSVPSTAWPWSSRTAPGTWPVMDDATSDFRYVRLHGETELYASGYTDASLDRWAQTCRDWMDDGHDVHVYFDNDAKGHAPYDAVRLVRRLGLPTTA